MIRTMKSMIKSAVLGAMLLLIPMWGMAQDMQSTSVMAPSGSQYRSPIVPVGSDNASPLSSTTYDAPSADRNGMRRIGPTEPGQGDTGSPIGDAWPLLAFAAISAGVVFLHKRKAAKAE